MKKKILFIGDSLTEFYDWEERFPRYKVFNLGISGERVEELYDRLPRVFSKINEIDYVFIMTGINNIAMEDFNIISSYKNIVKDMTEYYNKATLVIQSILPIRLYWIDNKLIRAINLSLKEIAEEFNAEYLDVYSLFVTEDDKANRLYLLEDGVHISNRGYEVWSQAVEDYLFKKEG